MRIPLLDLQAQYASIRDEVHAAIDRVFESQRFILGPEGAELEREIAAYCGVPSAVAVASGTDAILLSLKALGIGPGDSVITTPFTFFATAGAIVNVGARPVFADIEEEGMNMDLSILADLLQRECSFNLTTRRLIHNPSGTCVRALLPVHLFGQCAAMDGILATADRYGLPVVEDACQAIGSEYRGKRAGSMGDLGCFSFFPSKNLGGAGDGGMVVSRNPELAARVRLLRGHGAEPKYFHKIVGFNSRLDELQAAVLRVKLRRLEEWSEKRALNAEAYGRAFRAAALGAKVRLPVAQAERRHIYHQYSVRCADRDLLQKFLAERGIGTEIYYPVSLHVQECFRYLGYQATDCPQAQAAAGSVLSLPIYPELTGEQIQAIVASFADFYRPAQPSF